MIETIAVSFFALLAIGAAVYAALVRHTLHCIISLAVTLFGVAGIFLSLGSPFVAAMQILIYIGGISVAMVFALMLSVSLARKVEHSFRKVVGSIVAAGAFFTAMAVLIMTTEFPVREEPAPAEQWAVANIGHAFLTNYNVVFIGLSLTLLLAILAAVLVAGREEEPS